MDRLVKSMTASRTKSDFSRNSREHGTETLVGDAPLI